MQRWHHMRQEVRPECGEHTEPDRARLGVAHLPRNIVDVVALGQHSASVFHHTCARSGEQHLPRVALEQFYTEFTLELLDLGGECGLAHETRLGGAAEVTGADEGFEVFELAELISRLPNLTLRGLMSIPANVSDYESQLHEFQKLATLKQTLEAQFPEIDTLSMGMSGDMTAAIEAGSTMVRIGTAIFGARDYS